MQINEFNKKLKELRKQHPHSCSKLVTNIPIQELEVKLFFFSLI